MPDIAFQSLKQACHQQVLWLQAHAAEYERGKCQLLESCDGAIKDKSAEIAEQFRHQANNLQAVIDAYERLVAKQNPSSSALIHSDGSPP
jgi:hypothetical protein